MNFEPTLMKFGIVVFPGSNCDHDCHHVITHVLGHEAFFLWHTDTDLQGADALILPGGFSHGDYLRAGAMAASSPIMESVKAYAKQGGLVIGLCNGFQILQQARLLPGALMHNRSLKFICRNVFLRVDNERTPFTNLCRKGEVLRMPIAHMEGSFFLEPRLVTKLVADQRVLFRYCSADGELNDDVNPNGSFEAVAGIINEKGNVCGMMPHPERCSELLLGNRDGLKIFSSMIAAFEERHCAR